MKFEYKDEIARNVIFKKLDPKAQSAKDLHRNERSINVIP